MCGVATTSADGRALADEHERVDVGEPQGEHVVAHVVGPDRDVVTVQLAEARQLAQRVRVVVEDGDSHGWLMLSCPLPATYRPQRPPGQAGVARRPSAKLVTGEPNSYRR